MCVCVYTHTHEERHCLADLPRPPDQGSPISSPRTRAGRSLLAGPSRAGRMVSILPGPSPLGASSSLRPEWLHLRHAATRWQHRTSRRTLVQAACQDLGRPRSGSGAAQPSLHKDVPAPRPHTHTLTQVALPRDDRGAVRTLELGGVLAVLLQDVRFQGAALGEACLAHVALVGLLACAGRGGRGGLCRVAAPVLCSLSPDFSRVCPHLAGNPSLEPRQRSVPSGCVDRGPRGDSRTSGGYSSFR